MNKYYFLYLIIPLTFLITNIDSEAMVLKQDKEIFWTGAGDGSSWSDVSNWSKAFSDYNVNRKITIMIGFFSDDNTVHIDEDVALVFGDSLSIENGKTLVIDNGKSLNVRGGALLVDEGSTIENYGNIILAGEQVDVIGSYARGSIYNEGIIINHQEGKITNFDGTIYNNDESEAIIKNEGQIFNHCNGVIQNKNVIIGNPINELCNQNTNEDPKIPDWVKKTAGWWAAGEIGDSHFISGIQFLIKEEIMIIPSTQPGQGTSQEIPSWIKQNADWWSQGQISDESFVNGMQWLIENGIIRV